MHVESPTTADVDRLTDLWVDLADSQRAHGSHIDGETSRGCIEAAIGRHVVGNRIRVARVDGHIVGFVMFEVESGPLERHVDRGLIENLYVVPDYQCNGIGSALLESAEAALEERDVDVIALNVMAENDDAREFYREHGYEPHRTTVEKSIESDTHSKGDD